MEFEKNKNLKKLKGVFQKMSNTNNMSIL